MAAPLSIVDLDLVLAQTRELWEEMRGQRVFITGGTGFFGCWLVESFCHGEPRAGTGSERDGADARPGEVRRRRPRIWRAIRRLRCIAGDVRDFEFPAGEFRFVIHAATEASEKQAAEEPLEMLSTILAGTERTLQFAAQCGARKFLLTSSGAVYGRQPPEMTHVPESYDGAPDPLNPASVYAEGKRAAELMCAVFQNQINRQKAARTDGMEFEAKIARCWAFCGPHLPLDAHFAIGNFIGDVLAGRPISIAGDGTPRRSYLYAAELAAWLWTVLFRAPSLVPINVGSAHDVSILQLAECVAETLAPATDIHVARQAVPGALPARYVPSVERAEMLLGLRQTVGLEEAIRRTAAWHGYAV